MCPVRSQEFSSGKIHHIITIREKTWTRKDGRSLSFVLVSSIANMEEKEARAEDTLPGQ